MNKFKGLKKSMKNPPTERLCLIAARGSLFNILGVLIACIFLINVGLWYVGFAFVFSIIINWVTYKREMNQYNLIIEARKAAGIYQEIDKDPSFTRRRFRLISERLGSKVQWILISIITLGVVYFNDIGSQSILGRIGSVLLIIFIYVIVYLFPVYWIAQMKGEKK